MRGRSSIRQSWRGDLRAGALLLFLALLPTLLYFDHWGGPPPPHAGATPAEFAQHQGHCHFSVGSCSGQPSLTSAQALPKLVDLASPTFPEIAIDTITVVPEEFFASLLTEPPRL